MLEINLSSEDMVSYACDSPVELGIVIDRIKDVTKTLKTKDNLMIQYNDDETFITLKSNGLSRSVKLIDTNMVGRVPSRSRSNFVKWICYGCRFCTIIFIFKGSV